LFLLYSLGLIPNCLENALVNPSCESKTKSKATSTIRGLLSLSFSAARDSLRARIYSNGVFPVNSLKTLAECHGEHPSACASICSVIRSVIRDSTRSCIRWTASTLSRLSVFSPCDVSIYDGADLFLTGFAELLYP
jgi:hypothetical protein